MTTKPDLLWEKVQETEGDPIARLLVIIFSMTASGEINKEQKAYLKNMVLCQDDTINDLGCMPVQSIQDIQTIRTTLKALSVPALSQHKAQTVPRKKPSVLDVANITSVPDNECNECLSPFTNAMNAKMSSAGTGSQMLNAVMPQNPVPQPTPVNGQGFLAGFYPPYPYSQPPYQPFGGPPTGLPYYPYPIGVQYPGYGMGDTEKSMYPYPPMGPYHVPPETIPQMPQSALSEEVANMYVSPPVSQMKVRDHANMPQQNNQTSQQTNPAQVQSAVAPPTSPTSPLGAALYNRKRAHLKQQQQNQN